MAAAPSYAGAPGTEVVAMPANANANRDGTGVLVTVLTAGGSGTRVERLKVKATGTTTAGMIRVFLHNGVSAFLHEEIPVTAVVPSATVETWEGEVVYGDDNPLIIPTGWTIRCATHNAEAFHVTTVAGDF